MRGGRRASRIGTKSEQNEKTKSVAKTEPVFATDS